MTRCIILFFLLLFNCDVSAQLIFGWSGGYAPVRELNREIYIYNQINGHNLKDEMSEVHWFQGPVTGFRFQNNDGPFVELLYSRKRCKVESQFDSAGVEMNRQIKTLCNTWNFGFGVTTGNWTFGMSLDLGRFKGFGRRGPSSSIGENSWQRLWVVDNSRVAFISVRLIMMETIFIERKMGFLRVRLFAQLPGMGKTMDGLDDWLFGAPLNWELAQKQQFVNTGISVFISLERN
jgi:hypothetical protein